MMPSGRQQEIEVGVDEDGTIGDQFVETYYCPLENVLENSAQRFLRIIGDNGGTNVEIRLPFELLENNGWHREGTQ